MFKVYIEGVLVGIYETKEEAIEVADSYADEGFDVEVWS